MAVLLGGHFFCCTSDDSHAGSEALSGIIEVPAFGAIMFFPTGRCLETKGSPPPVPDDGATENVARLPLVRLVMARRFLKS